MGLHLGTGPEKAADSLHEAAFASPLLLRLAVLTRILLFLAFFPTGLVKLLGRPFASPAVGPELFAFFDALHATGPYWRFIGFGQVAAAVLLLTETTSALGALVFLAILSNIVVITYTLPFGVATFTVAMLMFLANLYVLCWEYPRWRSLMPWRSGTAYEPRKPAALTSVETAAFATFGITGTALFLATRSLLPFHSPSMGQPLQLAFLASMVALCIATLSAHRSRTRDTPGRAESSEALR